MPYCVEMDVQVPRDLDPAVFDRLKAEEKARAGTCGASPAATPTSASSTWPAMTGRASSCPTLPLFPFMQMKVTPLAQHPSAIAQE